MQDDLDHLIAGKTLRVDACAPHRHKKCVLVIVWDGQGNVDLLMVAMGDSEANEALPAKPDAGSCGRSRATPGETGEGM